jgi:hypothetical protein
VSTNTIRRVLAITLISGAMLATAACSTSSPGQPKATATTPAAAPILPSTSAEPGVVPSSVVPSSTPSGGAATSATAVTFDGDYTGSVKVIECSGSGATASAQVNATFSDGHGYPGTFGPTEFGFQGPSNEFDSGFLNTPLDSDGNGFVLDGLKATDADSGKSVTMHGTLRCPS